MPRESSDSDVLIMSGLGIDISGAQPAAQVQM